MKRTGLTVLTMTLAAALVACGADSKASRATQPAQAEPVNEAPVEVTPAPVEAAPAPTYLHGKWVWFELNTSDVEKVRAFYEPLLGWTIEDREMGGQSYTAILHGDKEIGLVQPLPAEEKAKKIPIAWRGYVSVSDVAAAVARATEMGAAVLMPTMDLPEIGTIAMLSDPKGAPFGLVKAAKGDDADKQPAAGDIIWMEHNAKDAKSSAAAAEFYAAVVGYEVEPMKMGKVTYTMAMADGEARMGFGKAPAAAAANRFVPYVVVANVDEIVKAATKAKAKVVQKPVDIPNVGRIAVLTDPQGAVFGVMTMAAPADASKPEAE